VARDECAEETGLTVEPERFRYHGVRQIASTMSCHRGHLFSVELSAEEIEILKSGRGKHYGSSSNERILVEVVDLDKATTHRSLDWSMLGMIWSVIK
jgi:8-oxo-dGTP pyrophosphatase MutT (NUDIX family)